VDHPAGDVDPTLHLLAAPHLRAGGQRHPLPPSAPGLLLACLAVHGAAVPRERVALLFWPDADEAQAQHHLRVTLHRSRQWLAARGAADRLRADRHQLRLDLRHDVADFRGAIAAADWPLADALHQAPLLDGVASKSLPELDDWFAAEREALRAQWRDAAHREAARLAQGGQATAAAAVLIRLLRDDLLAEDVLQALLRVAAEAGERATALDLHERFVRLAHGELGLAPMAETRALAEALRQRLVAPPTPVPAIVVTLPTSLSQPPLVGREAERAALAASTAPLWVIAGEPGVGKTRLLADGGGSALWWHCRTGLQGVPLLPVVEALQQQMTTLRQVVTERSALRELARLVPDLAGGELLPPVDTDSPRLLLALAELLPRLTPVLVVDDLQWADSVTLQLLRLLLLRGELRVRATLRPAETSPALARWLDEERAAGRLQEQALAPLAPTATAVLLERLAGQAAPRLAAWLQHATGGNPFFTLETLRTLFESGQLRVTDSGWARPLDDLGDGFRAPVVPPRVAALVQQRLDDLPEPTQRVMLACAVVGDAVHEELIAQVLGLSPWATAEALAQAQHGGLLQGARFVHDLTREALLARSPATLRRVIDAGVARHGQAALGAHRVAAHAWAAGLEAEAVEATLQASLKDRELGLIDEAQAMLAAAIVRTTDALRRARLELEAAECAETGGDLARADAHVQAVLERTGDPKLHALALAVRVVVFYNQGQLGRARQLADDIAALDPDWPDRHTIGGKLAYGAGDFAAAIAHMRAHVALLRTRGPSADLASALSGLATAMAGQGQLADSAPLHREAIAMARRFKARHFEVYAVSNFLWTATRLDSGHAEAVAIGRAALTLGEYTPSRRLRVNLGSLLQRLGEHAEAAALFEQEVRRGGDPTVGAVCWARLVDCWSALGRRPEIADAVEQGLAMFERTDAPAAQAAVVTAALEHGDAAQAQRALALVRDWPLPADQQQRLQAARQRHTPAG